jgi:hypothetical protein
MLTLVVTCVPVEMAESDFPSRYKENGRFLDTATLRRGWLLYPVYTRTTCMIFSNGMLDRVRCNMIGYLVDQY